MDNRKIIPSLIFDESVVDFLRESNNIENEWGDVELAQAIFAWNYLMDQDKMNPSVVLKTHKILMLKSGLLPNERGYFRKEPVWIGGKEAKPWFVVPELIDQWIQGVNQLVDGGKAVATKDVQEVFTKKHHIIFEGIHPFIDGNGRVGRLLLNWQRVKLGLPILVIEESKKNDYYKWFD